MQVKYLYQMITLSSLYYINREKGMLTVDNKNNIHVKCANSNLHAYIAKIFFLMKHYTAIQKCYLMQKGLKNVTQNIKFTLHLVQI